MRRCRAVWVAKGYPDQPCHVPSQRLETPRTASTLYQPEVCTRCFADHTDCANSPPLIKSLSVPRQGDTPVTAAGFRLVDGYIYIHQLHEQDATPVVFMLVLRLRPYRPNTFPPTCLLSHSATIPPRSHRERSNWAELPTLACIVAVMRRCPPFAC